jgi:ABC-type transporter MlaC component
MIPAAIFLWNSLKPGLSLIRTRWKEALIILGLMVLAWAWFRGDAAIHRAQRAEAKAAQVRTQVVVEKAQTALSDTAAKTADRAQSNALTITVKSQELASHVQAQPGASEVLPSGLRDATLAAIRELRQPTATAGVADDPGGAKPSRPVSTP